MVIVIDHQYDDSRTSLQMGLIPHGLRLLCVGMRALFRAHVVVYKSSTFVGVLFLL